MCGRFALTLSADELSRFVECPVPQNLTPHYNIAPAHGVMTVLHGARGRHTRGMRWGLPWSSADSALKSKRVINARKETLREKPMFQEAYATRRCLLPATAFYEWQKNPTTGKNQPFMITIKHTPCFAMAGLWNIVQEQGKKIGCCAIITTQASQELAPYHQRMPVILKQKAVAAWLDPTTPSTQLSSLLNQNQQESFVATPLSSAVNNARLDDSTVQTPASHPLS